LARAPERPRRCDVVRLVARAELGRQRLGTEDAAAAREHPDLAVERSQPAAAFDARGQREIEQMRARRRKQERALMPRQAPAREHRARLVEVRAAAAEPLLTEVVRHAARCDVGEAARRGIAVARDAAKYNCEQIRVERAALELARMARRAEHAKLRMRERAPVEV